MYKTTRRVVGLRDARTSRRKTSNHQATVSMPVLLHLDVSAILASSNLARNLDVLLIQHGLFSLSTILLSLSGHLSCFMISRVTFLRTNLEDVFGETPLERLIDGGTTFSSKWGSLIIVTAEEQRKHHQP